MNYFVRIPNEGHWSAWRNASCTVHNCPTCVRIPDELPVFTDEECAEADAAIVKAFYDYMSRPIPERTLSSNAYAEDARDGTDHPSYGNPTLESLPRWADHER